MASFLQAWPGIFKQEGGYVKDPNDPGGETYYGITRRDWPNWRGWTIVDSKPRHDGEVIPECEPYLQSFYKNNYWDVFSGDYVINQAASRSMLYNCINQGVGAAIENCQSAIGITADGKWGPATLAEFNRQNPYA
jgi:lysozyme family protein